MSRGCYPLSVHAGTLDIDPLENRRVTREVSEGLPLGQDQELGDCCLAAWVLTAAFLPSFSRRGSAVVLLTPFVHGFRV